MRRLEPSVLTALLFIAGCVLIWLPWNLGRLTEKLWSGVNLTPRPQTKRQKDHD
jgi:hypothetical protein